MKNARNVVLRIYLLLAMLSLSDTWGQNYADYFRTQIDSLDRVQPMLIELVEPEGDEFEIRVKNQQQFDGINDALSKAIESGETNIHIKIGCGLYHFHENHILRRDEQWTDVSITIEGKNAVLTSDDCFLKEPECPWRELEFADSLITVIDELKKLCKIPYKNTFADEGHSQFSKVQVMQWYKSTVYGVTRIDKEGIFFVAPELEYLERFGRNGYNVNYDYLYGGTLPRFRLYDSTKERSCMATCFINLQNAAYKMFTIKGLRFNGNKAGSSLIVVKNVKAEQITVSECGFDNIRSTVIRSSATSNVTIDNNHIRNTEGDEMYFTGGCRNVRVTNNQFENNGLCLTNKRCITCHEAEYYIADNIFKDFGRTAVGVGVWHGTEKKHLSKGIVEHNEIYYSTKGMFSKEKHTMMDGGCIYVWTQNDGAIIRYNYIHDYCGMKFNSGIYCDDGASNCKIYGNVILNTPDGYSIHSRKVKDQKEDFQNNANNFIAYNIVDGSVVLEGYGAEERHCKKGANVVLRSDESHLRKNRYTDLEIMEKDVVVEKWNYKNGKLIVPCDYEEIVKKAGVRK